MSESMVPELAESCHGKGYVDNNAYLQAVGGVD